MVKRMKNIDRNNNIPIIIVDNKEHIADDKKAEALANTFRLTSSGNNYEKLFLPKEILFSRKQKHGTVY